MIGTLKFTLPKISWILPRSRESCRAAVMSRFFDVPHVTSHLRVHHGPVNVGSPGTGSGSFIGPSASKAFFGPMTLLM